MPLVRGPDGHLHYIAAAADPGPGTPVPRVQAMLDRARVQSAAPEDVSEPDEGMGLRDWLAFGVRGLSGLGSIASAEPGIGTAIGAGLGSGGEWLAQQIEGRPETNWTQVGAQGALGAIPFGKVATVPRMMALGAGHGALGAGVTEAAETGELPSLKTIGTGAAIGAGGGLLGELIRGGIARRGAGVAAAAPAIEKYSTDPLAREAGFTDTSTYAKKNYRAPSSVVPFEPGAPRATPIDVQPTTGPARGYAQPYNSPLPIDDAGAAYAKAQRAASDLAATGFDPHAPNTSGYRPGAYGEPAAPVQASDYSGALAAREPGFEDVSGGTGANWRGPSSAVPFESPESPLRSFLLRDSSEPSTRPQTPIGVPDAETAAYLREQQELAAREAEAATRQAAVPPPELRPTGPGQTFDYTPRGSTPSIGLKPIPAAAPPTEEPSALAQLLTRAAEESRPAQAAEAIPEAAPVAPVPAAEPAPPGPSGGRTITVPEGHEAITGDAKVIAMNKIGTEYRTLRDVIAKMKAAGQPVAAEMELQRSQLARMLRHNVTTVEELPLSKSKRDAAVAAAAAKEAAATGGRGLSKGAAHVAAEAAEAAAEPKSTMLAKLKGREGDEAGFATPELLTSLGTGTAGALYGASEDEDNPLRGAAVGGLLGAAIPHAARTPWLERTRFASMLSSPLTHIKNVGSVVGSVLSAGYEKAVEQGDLGPLQRAVKELANVGETWKAGKTAFHDPGTSSKVSGGPGIPTSGLLSIPGKLLGAEDAGGRSILMRTGDFTADEAERYMGAGNPESAIGQDTLKWQRKDALRRFLMPFAKTAINYAEQGVERMDPRPLLDETATADARRLALGRLGMSAATGALGYETGQSDFLKEHPTLVPFLAAAAGPYAVPFAMGQGAGLAHRKVTDPATGASQALFQQLPLVSEYAGNPARILSSYAPNTGRDVVDLMQWLSRDRRPLDPSGAGNLGPFIAKIPGLAQTLHRKTPGVQSSAERRRAIRRKQQND